MERSAIFAALQGGWRWLAGGFALLAALAGALALVNRALGQKQGDRPRRKKAAEPPEQTAGTQEAPEPEQAEQTDLGSAPAEADGTGIRAGSVSVTASVTAIYGAKGE